MIHPANHLDRMWGILPESVRVKIGELVVQGEGQDLAAAVVLLKRYGFTQDEASQALVRLYPHLAAGDDCDGCGG